MIVWRYILRTHKAVAIVVAAPLVLATLLFLTFPRPLSAGSSDNLSGWAWSETIGWISFNSFNQGSGADYGVGVAPGGQMFGYAWSENIGWISFNDLDTAGCPSPPCQARMNRAMGEVSGWARACAGTINGDCTGPSRTDGWDGWIHLRGTAADGSSYGVFVAGCDWDGWAWGSDVVGWIHFRGATYSVVGSDDACMGAQTLSVDLTVGTDGVNFSQSFSGFAPLNGVDLKAEVGGTAQGTINYKFDCTNDGTYDHIFNNIPDNPKRVIDACNYPAVGNYTAKVRVERGFASPAEDTVAITVSPLPVPPPLTASCSPSPSGTVLETNPISWSSNVLGGTTPYSYSWSGDDGLSGSGSSVTKTYAIPDGPSQVKNASVAVADSVGGSTSASCSVTIRNPQCSDFADNDDDGKTDFPPDWGCDDKQDDDEYNLPLPKFIEILPR